MQSRHDREDKITIGIIDYGMGNSGSVANALSYLGIGWVVSSEPKLLRGLDGYIMPGVGAFGAAMKNLMDYGLVSLLEQEILQNKKPYLGICLGMQVLCNESFEHGHHRGLGWIDARVVEIPGKSGVKIPHVGWDDAVVRGEPHIFKGLSPRATFYFDHSFYVHCFEREIVASTTTYGIEFTSSIQKGHIWGTQFHPEKSQRSGLKLLRNFTNFVSEKKRGRS